jgi:hypothetical protein
MLILGSLKILDALRVPFYPTVNRMTRLEYFSVSQSLIIPLIILTATSIVYIFFKHQLGYGAIALSPVLFYPLNGFDLTLAIVSVTSVLTLLYLEGNYLRFLLWIMISSIVLNGFSLLHWTFLKIFNINTPLKGLALLNLDLFYVASYLAPIVVFPLLFIWLLKRGLDWAWSKHQLQKIPKTENVYLILLSAIILSAISAFYPYLPGINLNNANVGKDYPYYLKYTRIVADDLSQAFNVSGGSRTMIFYFILGFKNLTGLSISTTVRYIPAVLNPLLVVSLFYFTYEIFNDPTNAAWASFFTACGYQITVNQYSYFLTNMLGLILIFFSLGLLFRTLRTHDKISLITSFILGSLLVFTHPWTFFQFYTTTIMVLAITIYQYRKNEERKTYISPIIVYLIILLFVELVKIQLFHGVGGISAASVVTSQISDLSEFWFSSIITFRLLYGGFMSNILLLGLATIGAFLLDFDELRERFLLVLLLLTSMVFLIGDGTIKSRLLFNLPIGLFAAKGFLYIRRRLNEQRMKLAFTFFTVSSMILYLFQSLANLV